MPMNQMHLLTVATLLPWGAGCMDAPGFDRSSGVAEGEGEGAAEGEGEGAAEGEGEGAAEGEGEGAAEGEGEGPAEGEGEGEGPAEGEGEGAGPRVEQVASLDDFAAPIARVAFTWDGLEVGAYVPSGRVYFYVWADPDIGSRTANVDVTDDRSLFDDFDASPTLPLGVTRGTGGELQTWGLDQPGEVDYIASFDVGAHSDIHFESGGERVGFLRDGSVVIARVAGGISEAWAEPDYDEHPGQRMAFVGPDDWIAVIEVPETSRLRLRPNPEYEGPLTAVWRKPAECAGLVALSGARSVGRLAYLCADGAVRVAEVAPWRDLATLRGRLGGLDAIGISPDGRLLAATEGENLHVFSVDTGARTTVPAGEAESWHPAVLAFSPDGTHLAVNRRHHVRVFEVSARAPTG